MAKLVWDGTGEKIYETGVDHGVLYIPDTNGVYGAGVVWNGLTSVTDSPSGAEANPQYADNIKYINLISAEEYGATIEAFTYPDEFGQCDGTKSPSAGVQVGQQPRHPFGFVYRTKVGNDTVGQDFGYKLHLVWGALAAPSEKQYQTVNDSPEATAFSWEVTTTPVAVDLDGYKPTSTITVDSTKTPQAQMQALEEALFGTEGADGHLPSPTEVINMVGAGTVTEVETVAPTYNATTDMVTIPTVTGVVYKVDNEVVTGDIGPITEDTVVTASPAAGYKFTATSDTDWTINFA